MKFSSVSGNMRWPIRGQSSHLQLKLKWNADIESCNRAYCLFTESFNLYNACTIPFQTCQCALPLPPSSRHPFTIKRRRGDFQDKDEKTKKELEDIHTTPRWSNSSGYPFILAWHGIQIYALFYFICFGRWHKNWGKCRAHFSHQFYSRGVRKSKRNNNQKEERKKKRGSQKSS